MKRAERIVGSHQTITRIGTGFDVHGFCPGDHVVLGGVKITHDFGLEGHSDADAALHALTDALLGAIGDGDIGAHFPPTDPQWRGAASAAFLRHAAALIRDRGGEISNVDVTIICERPKITPHRTAMRAEIAAMLDIDESAVSVKATTTEGLGFTGRREGIAAQAVAAIRLPLI
jgi:2-C-methyl-D-erythritol 4-phosphate cytidylyltransferase/2-C-methyl-D-erythritol 2,4-cyclodiphosphate synthase